MIHYLNSLQKFTFRQKKGPLILSKQQMLTKSFAEILFINRKQITWITGKILFYQDLELHQTKSSMHFALDL